MSSAGDSPSPSLLQSLKRFRFKKKNVLTDDEDKEENSTSLSNGISCSSEQKRKEKSSDDENELVIIRRKKRLKIDNSEDSVDDCRVVKNVGSDSDDSETINSKKFKRLKFFNASASSSSNCDRKETGEVKKPVQKDIKFFFQKQTIDKNNDSSNSRLESSNENSSSQSNDQFKNSKNDEHSTKVATSPSCSSRSNDQLKKSENYASNDELMDSPSCSNNAEETNDVKKKKKKNKKRKKKNESDDETYFEGNVYDSDASDDEVTDDLTGMKGKVFEFLNSAPEEELKEIRCTQKKIKAFIDARPFRGWKHLVYTCEENRSIGTDILNATQNLLTSRKVLADLMHRCERIAKKTERAIADGATNITKEPSILSPGFQLKSYQMVGLNWLAVMHSQKISGILADEMGLGKTIQVISFLAYLKEKGLAIKNCPHLIVVPSSTLDNWCNEFERWCPGMIIAQYYGSQDERRHLRINWVSNGFNDVEVILSTYQVISGAYEDKKLFRVVNLHYAVFDEGHMLKNMNTMRYENLFKINSKHKLLLTGTPIQNSLLELMSLLMFVMPEMFASRRDFIKYLFEKKNKVTVQDQVKFERENVEVAKRIMKPFMLRRLKVDVLKDLPKKTTVITECPMVESQAIKYAELVEEFKNSAAGESTSVSHLAMFTDLRRLANHPLLLRYLFKDDQLSEMANLLAGDYDYKENEADKILEDLSYMSDHQLHKLSKSYKCLKKFGLPDPVFLESGKIAKFDELLPDLKAKNHRLLIFSQFIFVLDLLEEYLRIREYTFLRIDGSTPVYERQQLIDLYNTDMEIFIFLLTTKAGGMGINLTSADTVIINDVDFNPYNDKQAEDRCHRMGQTRDVKIIRFVSKGTIEEKIFKVAQEKTTLGHEVTTENDTEEQKNMLSLLNSALGL